LRTYPAREKHVEIIAIALFADVLRPSRSRLPER
jgi:hypothetical protein